MENEENEQPLSAKATAAVKALRRVEAAQEKIKRVWLPADYRSREDEPLPKSPLFEWLKSSHGLERMTNFNAAEIEALWRPVDEIMETEKKHRGPNADTSTLDHVVLYLMWLKSAITYNQLGLIAEMSDNMVEDNLNRVRYPLFEVLRRRWWNNRQRPKIRANSSLPPLGLIIDAHTVEIGVPQTDFRMAKRWFDGKNRIYGIKVEVAVSSAAPHYCMFVSEGQPAAKHDYEIHKEVFPSYIDYLRMTAEEAARAEKHQPAYWQILGDKAYTGSRHDTEPLVRVVPTRGPGLSLVDQAKNEEINRWRVVIEQFFGRLAVLWHTFNSTWRYDHNHFDYDYQIACMLTNCHMESTTLHHEDEEFYNKMLVARLRTFEEKKAKKTESARQKLARRRRLEESARVEQAVVEARRGPLGIRR
jgi:hypothetical protein